MFVRQPDASERTNGDRRKSIEDNERHSLASPLDSPADVLPFSADSMNCRDVKETETTNQFCPPLWITFSLSLLPFCTSFFFFSLSRMILFTTSRSLPSYEITFVEHGSKFYSSRLLLPSFYSPLPFGESTIPAFVRQREATKLERARRHACHMTFSGLNPN